MFFTSRFFLLGVIKHKSGRMNTSIPKLNGAMADYYLNNGHHEEARQLFERLVSNMNIYKLKATFQYSFDRLNSKSSNSLF